MALPEMNKRKRKKTTLKGLVKGAVKGATKPLKEKLERKPSGAEKAAQPKKEKGKGRGKESKGGQYENRSQTLGGALVKNLVVNPLRTVGKLAFAAVAHDIPEIGLFSSALGDLASDIRGLSRSKGESNRDMGMGGRGVNDNVADVGMSDNILNEINKSIINQSSILSSSFGSMATRLETLDDIYAELRALTSITSKVWDISKASLVAYRRENKKVVMKQRDKKFALDNAKTKNETIADLDKSLSMPSNTNQKEPVLDKVGGIETSLLKSAGSGLVKMLGGMVSGIGTAVSVIISGLTSLAPILLSVAAPLAALAVAATAIYLGVKEMHLGDNRTDAQAKADTMKAHGAAKIEGELGLASRWAANKITGNDNGEADANRNAAFRKANPNTKFTDMKAASYDSTDPIKKIAEMREAHPEVKYSKALPLPGQTTDHEEEFKKYKSDESAKSTTMQKFSNLLFGNPMDVVAKKRIDMGLSPLPEQNPDRPNTINSVAPTDKTRVGANNLKAQQATRDQIEATKDVATMNSGGNNNSSGGGVGVSNQSTTNNTTVINNYSSVQSPKDKVIESQLSR